MRNNPINLDRRGDRPWLHLLRGVGSSLVMGWITIPLVGLAMPQTQQHPTVTVGTPSAYPLTTHNRKQIPPEAQPVPIAIVNPANGRVTIQVNNQTEAAISYQVIDDTQFRTLGGRSAIALRDLALPTTLTFRRDDGGLLRVALAANNPTGTITLTLSETTDFSVDRTTLTIEPSGGVYLN